ncbi:hypothetical protein [Priestia megaterium]|uniref:hypothetical protein n=1 Tax=Priestia megaterium TaxID=1404 RepID=UPI002FFDDBF7
MKEKEKFPTRKDMTYWIIILILFMVGSFTVYYGSDKDMVSHIGFGGTIVSILLAVIAIIYSFYQSSTYESTTYKLDTSAQKIEEATKQLSDVSEIKAVLENFKGEVKEINDSIFDLKEISNTIGNGVDSMKESFEDTKQNIYSVLNTGPQNRDVDEIELSDEFFRKSLENIGSLPLFALVLSNEAKKSDISTLNLQKWGEHFVDETTSVENTDKRKELKKRFFNVQIGFLVAFNQLGIIDFKYMGGELVEIKGVNEKLSALLDEKVETLKDSENKKSKKLYEVLTNINKHLLDEDFS